jgi:predicted O-methyltransferase YrrM
MGLMEYVQFIPRQASVPVNERNTKKKIHKKWAEIDRYIADTLIPPDRALDSALELSQTAGLRDHSVSPNLGKLLMLLAQSVGARAILEIGT